MPSIFISYRRSDSADAAKLIYERLIKLFPGWQVFYDHKSLDYGDIFPDRIRDAVLRADIVLVTMGPRWLDILQERKSRTEKDFVLEEVTFALTGDRLVIPVLINNSVALAQHALEGFPDIAPLAEMHACTVRPEPDFESDVLRLAAFMEAKKGWIGEGALLANKYKLLSELGSGGMGVVYKALNLSTKQEVAVKLIKPGMDSREVLSRFNAERTALAMMDHPSVAKILDAGETLSGRPFFVMEYVKGLPITKYCDDHRLSPTERLQLMAGVCEAVQHAHQKGIIHRDLKPSNILVTKQGDKHLPKIIDFGLAKALGYQLTSNSVGSTEMGRVLGSLTYSSPEQAAGLTLEVDTRTDVYSLGVVLYELLIGEPPFSERELASIGEEAIRKAIINDEPSSLSKKLSSLDNRPTIASLRQTEPAKLERLVQGEMQWIVNKCLEKKPAERYSTCVSLAEDLSRYLNDLPISVGKPSAWSGLRKYYRRHRIQVLGVAAVFLSLVLGLIGTTTGLLEARRQWLLSVQANKDKDNALKSEQQARQTAEGRLKQLRQANSIVSDLVVTQNPLLPEYAQLPRNIVLAEKIERIVKQVDSISADDPETQAQLKSAIGQSLLDLGKFELAAQLLDDSYSVQAKQYGALDRRSLLTGTAAASAYLNLNKLEQASSLLKGQLDQFESRIDISPESNQLLPAIELLYGEVLFRDGNPTEGLNYIESSVEALRLTKGDEDPEVIGMEMLLLGRYSLTGENEKAKQMRTRLANKAGNSVNAALEENEGRATIDELRGAIISTDNARIKEAVKSVYLTSREKHGLHHPKTILYAIHYQQVLCLLDDYRESLSIGQETERLLDEYYEADNFLVLLNRAFIGNAMYGLKDYSGALNVIEPVRESLRSQFDANNLYALEVDSMYGISLARVDRLNEAEKVLEETIRTSTEVLGTDSPNTVGLKLALAKVYSELNPDREIQILSKLAEEIKGAAEKNPNFHVVYLQLARALAGRKEWAKSFEAANRSVIVCIKSNGYRSPLTQETFKQVNSIYYEFGPKSQEVAEKQRRLLVDEIEEIEGVEIEAKIRAFVDLARMVGRTVTRAEESFQMLQQAIARYREVGLEGTPSMKNTHEELVNLCNLLGRSQVALDEKMIWHHREVDALKELIKLEPQKTLRDRFELRARYRKLALALRKCEKWAEAIELYELIINEDTTYVGQEYYSVFMVEDTLEQASRLYLALGVPNKAVDSLKRLTELDKVSPNGKYGKWPHFADLLVALVEDGQEDEASNLAKSFDLADFKRSTNASEQKGNAGNSIGLFFAMAGDNQTALEWYNAAIASLTQRQANSEVYMDLYSNHAACLMDLGEYAAAESSYRKVVTAARQKENDPSSLAFGLATLTLSLLKQEKYVDAEIVARESWLIRQQIEPDLWTTHNAAGLVGRALFGQQKLMEAEALLASAFDKLTAEIDTIPVGGLDRLLEIGIDLKKTHEMQGNTEAVEKVQKWIEDIEKRKGAEAERR